MKYLRNGVNKMIYEGDLVVREIPYPKRHIKWSYDVLKDSSGSWDITKSMVSRVLLRYLLSGITVTFVNDKNEIVDILKSAK